MTRRSLTLVLAATFLWTGCGGRDPGDPLRPGFNVFSKEQDVQLGREAAQQIRQQVRIVENERLQSYVSKIGQRLASQPEAEGYPYSFTLINDPAINAFALPGGPIFVHTGLIQEADNEAQVAGVMAHEIAHVALRHGTNQASKANLLQLPAVLAGTVIGQDSILGQLGQIGIGLGVNSLILRYSRDAETQADALGARLMAKSGYNPIEMARFFEKLEAEGSSGAPQFLSSHPNPGNRVKAVQAEIQTFPQQEYATGQTGDFAQAKSMVAGLPKPDPSSTRARSAGALEPPRNVSGFQRFDTQRFSMEYPQGWQVFGDRNSSVLTIAPQQGLVRNSIGGVAVGYGAITSYFSPAGRRMNLRQGTSELLSQLRAANPMMEVAGNVQQVQVGGSPGLVTTLVGASPLGGREVNTLLTVQRPEGLFYIVFVSPENARAQLQPAFQEMIQSLTWRS
jgi:beta-barrel assembly-enhancing protease